MTVRRVLLVLLLGLGLTLHAPASASASGPFVAIFSPTAVTANGVISLTVNNPDQPTGQGVWFFFDSVLWSLVGIRAEGRCSVYPFLGGSVGMACENGTYELVVRGWLEPHPIDPGGRTPIEVSPGIYQAGVRQWIRVYPAGVEPVPEPCGGSVVGGGCVHIITPPEPQFTPAEKLEMLSNAEDLEAGIDQFEDTTDYACALTNGPTGLLDAIRKLIDTPASTITFQDMLPNACDYGGVNAMHERARGVVSHLRHLADDPPDPLFEQLATPAQLDAVETGTDAFAEATEDLADALGRAGELVSAVVTSMERSQGGHLAGSEYWPVRQTLAAKTHAEAAAAALADVVVAMDVFEDELRATYQRQYDTWQTITRGRYRRDVLNAARQLGVPARDINRALSSFVFIAPHDLDWSISDGFRSSVTSFSLTLDAFAGRLVAQ